MPYSPSVLADSVPFADISALLNSRKLTQERDGALIKILKEGIAVEVARLTGTDPADDIKDTAVRAVVVGTAWVWERSMYPRQLDADGSPAATLREAYLGLLEELKTFRSGEFSAITSGPYSLSLSG